VIHVVRGRRPRLSRAIELVVVDDDIGGPYPPPSRQPLLDGLRETGFDVVQEKKLTSGETPVVIALFGDIRAWKGRPGYSERARASVADVAAKARKAKRTVLVVQFSHPRLAVQIEAPNIVCAWGGETVMQRAAAAWLRSNKPG
jgi:hypothetical protein